MDEFYLKILSGNHQGAEIPLSPGEYTLGKGDQCDLVLTDTTLSDTELLIEIDSDGTLNVFSKNQNTPLYCNGVPTDSPAQINFFDIVTSSDLFFTLGATDADWPEMVLPSLQKPSQPEENNNSELDEEVFPDTELMENEPFSGDEDVEFMEDRVISSPFEGKGKWIVGGIALFFISGIALMAYLLSMDSEPEEQLQINYLEQATDIKNKLKLSNVQLRQLPNETIFLTGYIDTIHDKQSLQKELRNESIPFSSQLIIMNELRASADALLKDRGYKNLTLELDNTPGSLILAGYVTDTDDLEKVVDMLKQEVYGLTSVLDQVENQASRFNALKKLLNEKKLISRVSLVQKRDEIAIEIQLLDDEQLYNLNDVIKQFRKKYGNKPRLKQVAISAENVNSIAKSNNPSLMISGVSMGQIPYVTMQDGSKYLIGAKLSNGYVIEDINLDYLLLSNGVSKVKYRLGGSREANRNQQ